MKEFIKNWREEISGENKFFLYRQNNSGGCFDQDENVDVNVIIEAKSEYESNRIAEDIGIYFDGVDKGWDCNCCGDRWSDSPDYYDTIEEALEDTCTMWGGTIAYLADGKLYRIEVEDDKL